MASVLSVILRVTGQNTAGGAITGLNQGLQLTQAVVQGLNDTFGEMIRQGVAMNSFLESSELQFKTLTGSADVARDHVGMLADMAAHTPFTFESVTIASRQLEVFGGAALDTQDNLRMLGDAAAATGAPIEQVTFWTGRLYSQLQAGKPIGEASRWLQRMGVMSGEARQQLDALSESGASGAQIWAAFTESQRRFSGAMKEQEHTWVGLTSTMGDLFQLWEGMATRGAFKQLEQEVLEFNRVLASPAAAAAAKGLDATLTGLFDPFVRLTEIITGDTEALLKNAGAWDGTARAAVEAARRAEEAAPKWQDLKTAGAEWLRQQQAMANSAAFLSDDTNDAIQREQELLASLGMALAANETNLDHWDAIARQAGGTTKDNAEIWQNWQQHLRETNDALEQQGQALAMLNQQGDMFTRHPAAPPTTDRDIQQAEQEREDFLKRYADAVKRNQDQIAQDSFEQAAKTQEDINRVTQDGIDRRREMEDRATDDVRRAQERALQDVRQAQDRASGSQADAILKSIKDQQDARTSQFDAEITAAGRARDAQLKALGDEKDAAQSAADAQVRGLERIENAAQRRHDRAIRDIEAEKDARLGALDAQIAALDAQAQAESRAEQDRRDRRTISDDEADLAKARREGDHDDITAAARRLADDQHSIDLEMAQRAREDERARLQVAKDAVSKEIDARKQVADDSLKAEKDALDARKQMVKERLAMQMDAIVQESDATKALGDADIQQLKDRKDAAVAYYRDRYEAAQAVISAEKQLVSDARQAEDRDISDTRQAQDRATQDARKGYATVGSAAQQSGQVAATAFDPVIAQLDAIAARGYGAADSIRSLAGEMASLGGGGGGGGGPAGGGGGGGKFIKMNRPFTHFEGAFPFVQPVYIYNTITNHGPVGIDDLDKQIVDTVKSGMRSGAIPPIGR